MVSLEKERVYVCVLRDDNRICIAIKYIYIYIYIWAGRAKLFAVLSTL